MEFIFYSESQKDAAIWINDNIHKSPITLLGKNGTGKKHIIENMEFEDSTIRKIPFISEVRNMQELFRVLIELYCPDESNFELGSFTSLGENGTFGISLFSLAKSLFSKIKNLTKDDFSDYKSKIINLFKKTTKTNKYVLPIYLYKDTSFDLIEFLSTELNEIGIYVIFLIDSNDYKFSIIDDKIIPKYIINITNVEIKNYLTNYFQEQHIEDSALEEIIKYANENLNIIKEITFYFDKQKLKKIDNLDKIFVQKIDILTDEEYNYLKFLSYFENDLSIIELNFVYNILHKNLDVYNPLNSLIHTLINDSILIKEKDFYRFIVNYFKNILKARGEADKEFYLKNIEKCICKINPLDYKSRYNYLKQTSDKTKIDEILFMLKIHELRTENIVKNEDSFYEESLNEIFKQIEETHNLINKGLFYEATKLVDCINYTNSEAITSEIDYLKSTCYWKESSTQKPLCVDRLCRIICNSKSEWETKFLAQMKLFTIYVNDAQYHKDALEKARKIFNDLEIELSKKNDFTSLLYLNILRRKSNAVFDSKKSIELLNSSLTFFEKYKDEFNDEYSMVLCNYCAVLLNLGNFESSYNVFLKHNQGTIDNKQWLYLENNFVISSFFVNKLSEKNLKIFLEKIDALENDDAKILFYINIANVYFSLGNHLLGETIMHKAFELNSNYDDYYNYFIHSNLCIHYLIKGDQESAEQEYIKSNFVPQLYKSYEGQYIQYRNEIIGGLIKSKKRFNFEDLSSNMKLAFDSRFITNNTAFFNTPYIFSDIQFWSEN